MNTKTEPAEDFRQTIIDVLRTNIGVKQTIAEVLADEIVIGLKGRMGGFYVPHAEIRGARDSAIRREFTGANHAQLRIKWDVSRATLYRILDTKTAPVGQSITMPAKPVASANCLTHKKNETETPRQNHEKTARISL